MGHLSGKELRDCVETLCPMLDRYAQKRFGRTVETTAWQNFSRWGVAAITHEKETYQAAFTAWWLFAWLPDDQGPKGEKFLIPAPDHAIAADYLHLHRDHLSPLEQKTIESAVVSPHSFYIVLSTESDHQLKLQEIYTQRRVTVDTGVGACRSEGEVLFGAVLSVDGASILLGCMPQILNTNSQIKIEAHREKWRKEVGKAIDQRQLYLHDTELRRYYFVLLDQQQRANLH